MVQMYLADECSDIMLSSSDKPVESLSGEFLKKVNDFRSEMIKLNIPLEAPAMAILTIFNDF